MNERCPKCDADAWDVRVESKERFCRLCASRDQLRDALTMEKEHKAERDETEKYLVEEVDARSADGVQHEALIASVRKSLLQLTEEVAKIAAYDLIVKYAPSKAKELRDLVASFKLVAEREVA